MKLGRLKNAWLWPGLGLLCLLTIVFGLWLSINPPHARAAAFTAGNVVVYRVGDGSGSLVNSGSAVFLDEYTPTGTLVQSIALPTTASGSNKPLIASGTATSEGLLTRSSDGKYVTLTGYGRAVGGAGLLSGTSSATVPRVVGRVDASGTVDTSTGLTDFSDGNNPRSVVSTDGNSLWLGGGTGGVHYATLGSSTSVTLTDVTTFSNVRQVNIFGGQLYASSSSGTNGFKGVDTIGTGTPTSGIQIVTRLPGLSDTITPSSYSYYLADLSSTVPGVDTLYVADDTLGLQKFSLVSGSWVSNGTVGTGTDLYRGLTAITNGTNVTLYATRKGGGGATGGGELVSLSDTSGYNATLSGTPTLLATAATNTAFRGIALAPQNPPAQPDLTVNVTGPATATTGANFNYVLTAANGGGANASSVSVSFTLPSGVTYQSASGTNGFTAAQAGGVVTFTGGTLNSSSSATLTVTVSAASATTVNLPAGAAVIDPADTIVESNEANNASTNTVSTVVSSIPDLTVSVSGPASAGVGANFNYLITAANGGTGNASGVVVSFTLPSGVTYQSATGSSGFTASQAGSVVTFTGGAINAGSSAPLTVTVSSASAATITLPAGAAMIDPANTIAESNEANNVSTSVVTTVVSIQAQANNDTYSADAGLPLVKNAAQGILANDTGGPLQIITHSDPTHGTLVLQPDGSFSYTPQAGFSGADTFTYTVSNAVQLYSTNLPPLATIGGVKVTAGGYGSSLYPVPGSSNEYYGITDRGPNVDGPGGTKVEPIPSFVPAIGKFKLVNGQAQLEQVISMTDASGNPYSGRVNSQATTGETITDLNGNVLPADPNGYDPEGLVALPDGTFWISDEYGPFITHFDATGKQIGRLSPFDNSLPGELKLRVPNRGMEGLTVTPDGSMLVGVMQSALQQGDIGATDPKKIAALRIVTYKFSNGDLHEYLYLLDNPGSNKTSVSEITALSNTTFLVDERDGNYPPGAYKKLWRIDLTGATDVGPASPVANASYNSTSGLVITSTGNVTNTIESLVGTQNTTTAASTLSGKGITVVSKSLYLDTGLLLQTLDAQGRFFSHDKLEGVAVINGGSQIVISNDSDFGIDGIVGTTTPYQLHAKTSPATGKQDDGEFLVVNMNNLPASTSTATVTFNVCNSFNVTGSSDDGTGGCGTLSRALQASGSATSPVTITLASPVITLTGTLPTITPTVSVAISGTCTPSGTFSTPGTHLVAGTGAASTGITLTNNIRLSGVAITGFSGYAVKIIGSNNSLGCSWLGTADGTTKAPNGGGLDLIGSNNLIGSLSQPNLIVGNNGPGLLVEAGSKGNRATYTWVGLASDGLTPLRNTGPALLVTAGGNLLLGPGNRFHS